MRKADKILYIQLLILFISAISIELFMWYLIFVVHIFG